MAGELDDPHLSGDAHPAHAQPAILEPAVIVGIDAVIAVVLLDRLGGAVQLGGAGAGAKMNRLPLSNE